MLFSVCGYLLQEALRCNDPLKVYRQMALNFEQNGKWHDADKLYAVMLKKFKQDKAIWLNACVFYVRSGKLDMARSVLQKALLSLDKKEREYRVHIQEFGLDWLRSPSVSCF